jgi:rhodanese-related sulfurtransferase
MDNVAGCLEDGMTAWFHEGLPVDQVPQVAVRDVHREIERLQVVDVRQSGEWEQGHIAQASAPEAVSPFPPGQEARAATAACPATTATPGPNRVRYRAHVVLQFR